ncbi:hypothetical protein SAMN05445060_1971 [Williamsia sterculiae]|uniref:Uncharacterized protein n=1 Tax=Williamsia sterculiae TaxID=1344003 RepID=A0A1N7FE34_9NOCA|nr:hypothetical protein SAMN05445060_1971 [Williamsia sterculiae]
MTDRYLHIRAAEDLGGLEMYPDHTEDLRAKNGLGTGRHNRSEAQVPTNTHEGEELQ